MNNSKSFTVIGRHNVATRHDVVVVNPEIGVEIVINQVTRKTKKNLLLSAQGNEEFCNAIESTTGWDVLDDNWSYDAAGKFLVFGGGWFVKFGDAIKEQYEVVYH